jgi:two-component system LytT family response regulator
MPKIRSIIVDDEPGNIVTLRELLKGYCPRVDVVATAQNPVEAQELIEKLKPELVFLDIEMPFGNAFTMLDKMAPVSFEIIFVTAFNDHAITAFRYSALDYLLKPVSITEHIKAVDRASEKLQDKNINIRVASLLENLKAESSKMNQIGLPTRDGFYFENLNNIIYLEADGGYTNIFLKGGSREVVTKSLNYFDEILPTTTFCRVHHSYMVNMNCIKKYFKGRGGYVEMENGSTIEISARKREEFLTRFVH